MFRRVLSGLFVAALALAGAAVAPVRADSAAGWISPEHAALAQPGRADRVSRTPEGRGASQHPGLAVLPAALALEKASSQPLTAAGRASLRLPAAPRSPHGARAPPGRSLK